MSNISGIGSSGGLFSGTTVNVNNTLATAANAALASNNLASIGQTPFSDLNLTPSQQTQIQKILQNAQTQGLSQSQVQAQINAVLTPTQQAQLQQDLQHHHHRHGGGGGSNSNVSNDDTDEFGIPTTLASASTTSAGIIANIAASYSVQSQYQSGDD